LASEGSVSVIFQKPGFRKIAISKLNYKVELKIIPLQRIISSLHLIRREPIIHGDSHFVVFIGFKCNFFPENVLDTKPLRWSRKGKDFFPDHIGLCLTVLKLVIVQNEENKEVKHATYIHFKPCRLFLMDKLSNKDSLSYLLQKELRGFP
jgi:hypothetical protein